MLTLITNLDRLSVANSKKRCRCCKKYGKTEEMYKTPNNAYFCDTSCATEYAYANKEKGKKIKHKAQKKSLKDNDRSLRMREAQKAFNAYIRARDKGQPCISCKRTTGAKINAGHYKSVGANPELRFEELNCHLQCEHCNSFKSGNIDHYRPNLIDKIGLENVEWLEGPHEPKKYTCEQLKEIELKYKDKIKELER